MNYRKALWFSQRHRDTEGGELRSEIGGPREQGIMGKLRIARILQIGGRGRKFNFQYPLFGGERIPKVGQDEDFNCRGRACSIPLGDQGLRSPPFLEEPGRSPDLRESGRPCKTGTVRNREDILSGDRAGLFGGRGVIMDHSHVIVLKIEDEFLEEDSVCF
jgi:hypothetical protein